MAQMTANKLSVVKATAPSHWATYLINGDSSGMEDAELEQANAFEEWIGGPIVSCDDAGFMWTHDAMRVSGALAADCQTYSALVKEGLPEETN